MAQLSRAGSATVGIPFAAAPTTSRPPAASGSRTLTSGLEQVTTGVQTQPDQVASRRDPVLDNAKFVAILLVVVGHAIELLVDIPVVKATYVAIYAFHMPVFILVAGFLSRRYTGRPDQARRLITGIAVPYLVFEVTYELFNHYAGGGSTAIDVLSPSYAMWFLAALFIWRFTAQCWLALHPVVAVAVAVVASLVSGATPLPQFLDLHRIFGFLPFFVLGLVLPGRYFELLRTRTARYLAVPTLAVPFLLSYFVFPDTQLNWLYYTFSYHEMGISPWFGMFGRALVLVGSFATLSAFLALMPRRRMWFTALGASTMYVYLVHRFGIKSAEYAGLYDYPWMHTLAAAGVTVVAALALGMVLFSPPAIALFRPLVEPRLEWLFRSRQGGSVGSRRADTPTR